MKIQCNVCEVAEANVLCCADEAALCWACDQKIHAANKLASKHQRLPLTTTSTQMPKCDICQETVGYFFCLEDRALLCRKCDVAIHTANSYVSAHQRFLLTGVKVGLETTEPAASSSSGMTQFSGKISEPDFHSILKRTAPVSSDGQCNNIIPAQAGTVGDFMPMKTPETGGSGSIPQWQLEDYLGINNFNQSNSYTENGSSEADCGRFGDSDCSPILRAGEEELDADARLGEVPETSWAVPQIPSPPTASGIHWPKSYQNLPDCAVYVPDICSSPFQYFNQSQSSNLKKRRQQF